MMFVATYSQHKAKQYAAAYVYPARIFISEDFPAPLGPIIAVKWPEHKRPDIRFSIVLKPTRKHTPPWMNEDFNG